MRRKVLLLLSRIMTEFHHGVARYACEHQWHLTSSLVFDERKLKSWKGDGIICSLGSDERLVEQVLSYGLPVIDLVKTRSEIDVDRILVNEDEVCRMAVEHFQERGFNNIAFWGHPGWPAEELRRQTFLRELAKDPHQWQSITILNNSKDTHLLDFDNLTEFIHQRVQLLPRPCAVFCFNDTCATELIEACLISGIRVPEEISVLGVNNNVLLQDQCPVPLSSIDTRMRQRGYMAAQRLDEIIQNPGGSPQTSLLPPAGVISRRSSDSAFCQHPGVQTALDFIRRQLGQPINAEDVCGAVGMSRRGLEKAFEKHLKTSILTTIQKYRINHARNLLQNPELSINEIQKNCGFIYPQPFYRAFEKLTGTTPGEYRRNFS